MQTGRTMGSRTRLALLLLFLLLGPGAEAAWGRQAQKPSIFRRAASSVYQGASAVFGEDNVRAVYKFFARLTKGPEKEVFLLPDPLWKLWVDMLGVFGIDANDLIHYFRPAEVMNNPTGALVLVCAFLLTYWLLSLLLGCLFHLLYSLFGPSFWIARITLFAFSCVYILQKYSAEPEQAILRLCLVVAIYFMTCPVSFYCSC